MAVRIKWNLRAFRQIRHAYAGHVEELARQVAAELPPGYQVVVQDSPGSQRPRAYIVAHTYEARRDDAKNATLLKKIASIRG